MPRLTMLRLCTILLAGCALTQACAQSKVEPGVQSGPPAGNAALTQGPQPRAYRLQGDYAMTHDPSIARDGSTYYLFATSMPHDDGQLPIRCSEDLVNWRPCGHVFSSMPAWVRERSPGTTELWAPDISYSHGIYRLYYAYSLFGVNRSGIGLAVNKTLNPSSPDYRWIDQGLILSSGPADDFNAIDPNYVEDDRGRAWLSFGSFWGGIKMRALDAGTGRLLRSDTTLYSLAARVRPPHVAAQPFDPEHPTLPPDWQAIEAPFILPHAGFYYLFVSYDLCCRGTRSTYHTMVGRSRRVTGPYIDRDGKPMQQGGGSLLLGANARWLGPGGASLLRLADGSDIIVFHAYDGKTGTPALQVSSIAWQDGWPVAALNTD